MNRKSNVDSLMRKRVSAAPISDVEMIAMLKSTESMTEPISPISSSKRKLRQAEEINKYINAQMIIPEQNDLRSMQQKKVIGS